MNNIFKSNILCVILMIIVLLSLSHVSTVCAHILVSSPNGTYQSKESLRAAIVASNDEACTIVITSPISVDDVTIPVNITLKIEQGGNISINNGKHLVIKGQFIAGFQQVFMGNGTVTFEFGTVKEVYPQWWGAVGNYIDKDNSGIDSTMAFNKAILAAQGKAPVKIISGKYKITDSLVLYRGSQIIGSNSYPTDKRSVVGDSTIYLVTSKHNTNLFTTDTVNTESGYLWGIHISNLKLIGSGNIPGCSGIYLNKVASSTFENIGISEFANGLFTNAGMFCKYSKLSIKNCFRAALYMAGKGIATTQTFDNCTFRESPWGAIIESTTTGYNMSIIFNSCTFESTTVGGINVHKSCSVEFIQCYAENLPDDRHIADGVMIRAHFDGHDKSPYNSNIKILGGEWSGGNYSLHKSSKFIECDYTKHLNITDALIQRATTGITATSNTKNNAIALSNPSFISVKTLYESTAVGKITGIYPLTNISGSNTMQIKSNFINLKLKTFVNNEEAIKGELTFGDLYKTPTGTVMIVY